MSTATLAPDTDAKIKALSDEAAALVEKVDNEGRDFTDDEQSRIHAIFDEAKTLRAAGKAAKTTAERAAERAHLLDTIKGLVDPEEAAALNKAATAAKPTPAPGKALTPYDRFVSDPGMKAFYEQWPEGIPDSVKGIRTPTVRMGGMKQIITSEVVGAGGLVQPDWLGMLDPFYQRPLVVRDVVTNGTTTSDTIEYARLASVTSNAAVVPEATDTAGSGTKPQSTMTFEKVSTTVKTIAHWLAATKRALADTGQLRTLINEFLRYGLEEELEDQIVNGDGTGDNFQGLLNTPGTLAQPFTDDMITTIRKAITQVQLTGRTQPNAILISPADDEAFDLLKGGDGNYIQGNLVPWVAGQPRTIWGITRVVSEAIPDGTALLGNFRFAVLWDREAATLTATDSHDDFFIRNLIAILAELRAAFGVLRPQAFCEVALAATTP